MTKTDNTYRLKYRKARCLCWQQPNEWISVAATWRRGISLKLLILLGCSAIVGSGCKKLYTPPAILADNRFLVIDGTLISSADSQSVILLSRTTRLTDSTINSSAENGAQVSVESNTGQVISLYEQSPGNYTTQPVLLNSSAKYRLNITTASGEQYVSDYVEEKQTPPIDSLHWQQQNDVTVYANTHDPSNTTKYYRWDYVETWEYHARLTTDYGEANDRIYNLDATNQQYYCWSFDNSSQIILGSSVALSQDVISEAPVVTVLQNSPKIAQRYSVLVKQYALTEAGYQYFKLLKKNTESLGSIFDAQPTQLSGNIHAVANPAEVVVGFFSASSVEQKRIFIDKNEVVDWNPPDTGRSCDLKEIPHNPNDFFSYGYPDPEWAPYYFGSSTSLILTRRSCVDCRLRGGTSIKPIYW